MSFHAADLLRKARGLVASGPFRIASIVVLTPATVIFLNAYGYDVRAACVARVHVRRCPRDERVRHEGLFTASLDDLACIMRHDPLRKPTVRSLSPRGRSQTLSGRPL